MLVNHSHSTQLHQLPANSMADNARVGMQAGQHQVTAASVKIAQVHLPEQNVSLSGELVNLLEGELVFKANARSMEVASSLFDTLLAIKEDGQGEREGVRR